MKKGKTMNKLMLSVLIGAAMFGCSNEQATESNIAMMPAYEGDATIWPAITPPIQQDPEMEARITDIISKMSLEHKVGQMVQGELRHVRPEHVLKYRLGSVLNGGGSHPNGERYSTIDDWLDIADGYYEASMVEDGLDHEPIPIIWGTDAVHGHNNVVGAVLFPHNFGLGAAGNPELMSGIGRATARQVIATGIDWTFAPTVAVAMDYRWGRSYESYGQNPEMVRDYAYEMVAAIQGETDEERFQDGRIISTVKHYVGDGGTTQGIDQGETTITEEELFNIHAQGYIGGLEAGAQSVMASFNSWNGEKLHGHYYMLTTVLKERMGFDGFIVGDWNGHGQIPGCTNAHCAEAINAGVDVIMVPDDWEAFLLNTIDDVNNGRISHERIDDAVRRILRVKMRAGLFDTVKPSERYLAGSEDALWGDEVRELSRDAVRQSLVLLKNNDSALPLVEGERILVVGNAAQDLSRQVGGWSITWQGTETSEVDFPNATKISDALVAFGAARGSEVVVTDSITDAEGDFDKIVVIFGETAYAEFNGDRMHIAYSEMESDSLALLNEAKATGVPVVSVFISGRPMWANPEINASDAFVAAWLPGSEGQGVADVLWGDFDFTGRLPGSWPLSSEGGELELGAGGSYESAEAPITQALTESYNIQANTGGIAVFVGAPGENINIEQHNTIVSVEDRLVQEDARRIDFNSADSQLAFSFGEATNLTGFRRYDARVAFALKVNEAPADATLSLNIESQMNDYSLDATGMLTISKGEWVEWSVPLFCIAPDVSSLSSTSAPFVVAASEGVSLSLANVRWEYADVQDYDCANTWAGDNHREPVLTPR